MCSTGATYKLRVSPAPPSPYNEKKTVFKRGPTYIHRPDRHLSLVGVGDREQQRPALLSTTTPFRLMSSQPNPTCVQLTPRSRLARSTNS